MNFPNKWISRPKQWYKWLSDLSIIFHSLKITLYFKNCKSRIIRQSTVHTWFTVTSREKIKAKSPQFVQKRTRLLWEEDKCGQLMWHNFSLFFCNFKTLSFIYLLSRFKVLMENLCFENFLLLHKFSIKYLEFNNRSQLCKCWIIYSGKVQNRWFLWFLCNSPMTRGSTIEFLIYGCRNAWIVNYKISTKTLHKILSDNAQTLNEFNLWYFLIFS